MQNIGELFKVQFAELEDFSEKEAKMNVICANDCYPVQFVFTPMQQRQVSMFDRNVPCDKEQELRIICGLQTDILGTVEIDIPANVLKKIIGKCEKTAALYYHAFMQAQTAEIE